jgi:hypothetical protein
VPGRELLDRALLHGGIGRADRALIGSPQAGADVQLPGAAYVFARSGSTWRWFGARASTPAHARHQGMVTNTAVPQALTSMPRTIA